MSQTINKLIDEGRLAVVGAIYDVTSGKVEFLINDAVGLPKVAVLAVNRP